MLFFKHLTSHNPIVRWWRSCIVYRIGLLCTRCNKSVSIRVSKYRLFRYLENNLMIQEVFHPRIYPAWKRELILQWYNSRVGRTNHYMCDECWDECFYDEVAS